LAKKNRTIIIIGAGLSGMSAGCYGQMNGYQTKIYEMHYVPGGCCTAWQRKDYLFDPCIEWMWGSGYHSISNQIWRELGALTGKQIKDFDVFNHVRNVDGQTVSFHVNPDKLEAHLLGISPEDKEPIEEFCDGLRAFAKVDFDTPLITPLSLMGFFKKLSYIGSLYPYFKLFGDAEETQLSEFLKRFKNPFLREAFRFIFYQDHIIFPLFPYYTNVAAAIKKNAGFPEGGALEVAKSVACRYEKLGGQIVYRKRAKKIIVKGNRAIGVEFTDGTKDYADVIISACDGRTVIYDMLEGKYTNKNIDTLYRDYLKEPYIYEGLVGVFLGVNKDYSNEPHSVTYLLTDLEEEDLPCVREKSIVIQFRTNYWPGFAPEGKSVIFAYYLTDHDYWQKLYQDKDAYNAEKDKVAKFAMEFLEEKYPGLRKAIEVIDVSTPMTMVRYTGNYKGSILAWKAFSQAEKLAEKVKGMKLPGLKNFYMTGHWVSMGGLIRAAASGRHVIQHLCRDKGIKFKAWEDKGGNLTEAESSQVTDKLTAAARE
jgi:phytoene dehydrogenase-like protein